jgi:hypothetical protein
LLIAKYKNFRFILSAVVGCGAFISFNPSWAADDWPPPPPVSVTGNSGGGAGQYSRDEQSVYKNRVIERLPPWEDRNYRQQDSYQANSWASTRQSDRTLQSSQHYSDLQELRRQNPWASGGVNSGYGNYPPLNGRGVAHISEGSRKGRKDLGGKEKLWSQWGKAPYQADRRYSQPIAPGWSNAPQNNGGLPFGMGGLPDSGGAGFPDFGFPF